MPDPRATTLPGLWRLKHMASNKSETVRPCSLEEGRIPWNSKGGKACSTTPCLWIFTLAWSLNNELPPHPLVHPRRYPRAKTAISGGYSGREAKRTNRSTGKENSLHEAAGVSSAPRAHQLLEGRPGGSHPPPSAARPLRQYAARLGTSPRGRHRGMTGQCSRAHTRLRDAPEGGESYTHTPVEYGKTKKLPRQIRRETSHRCG